MELANPSHVKMVVKIDWWSESTVESIGCHRFDHCTSSSNAAEMSKSGWNSQEVIRSEQEKHVRFISLNELHLSRVFYKVVVSVSKGEVLQHWPL